MFYFRPVLFRVLRKYCILIGFVLFAAFYCIVINVSSQQECIIIFKQFSSALPVKGMFCHSILLVFVTLLSNLTTYADYVPRPERSGQEIILCRKCGADIADTNYLFSKLSPGAVTQENKKIFGKQNLTVQTLVNPYGVQFEIVTFEKARCENIGHDQGADSWFPGYTWRICVCQHCGQHLGWTFKRSEHLHDQIQSFNGLILSNILGENFTDSLIMMPKMYKM